MLHQFSEPDKDRPSNTFPASRTIDLAITEADGEAVLYDEIRNEIHRLNPTALAIWHLTDGSRAAHQVGIEASLRLGSIVDEQAVRMAWTLMDDRNLLESPLAPEIRIATRTRRSFLKGMLVAGAAALPMIVSISAPKAAAAASAECIRRDRACSSDAQCCTGYCNLDTQTCS